MADKMTHTDDSVEVRDVSSPHSVHTEDNTRHLTRTLWVNVGTQLKEETLLELA